MMNLNNLNYKIMTSSIIHIINIKKKIIYRNKNLLLHVLKLNNVNLEYQCQSGYCGTCRIELIKGKIFYLIKQPIAALFKATEIFPCCCKPDGDITIKI